MSYSWHIVGVFVDSALNVEKNRAATSCELTCKHADVCVVAYCQQTIMFLVSWDACAKDIIPRLRENLSLQMQVHASNAPLDTFRKA